jgi:hypothetical protein
MRRRTRKLKQTAIESLTLAVEVFNRPSETARTQGVLLNLQHAVEMLLKAIVFESAGSITPKRSGKAFSFKECLGKVRGLGHLDEDEAVVAATIDAHRDGVQHQGAELTEERLYIDAASGLRLFDELLHRAFGERLADHPEFANRMLPIAANPPRELFVLTTNDVDRIRDLLAPGKRRHAEAHAFLRTLVMSEQVAHNPMGEVEHPTDSQLETFARKLQSDSDWTKLLPGLGRLALEHDEGVTYNVRIVKKGDVPAVRLVDPAERGAEDAVSILRYNELDRYPFYLHDLEERAGLNRYEALAMVHLLAVRADEESYKVFRMGKQEHARYSHKALRALREGKSAGRLEEAKQAYREHLRARREAKMATAAG